jgi:hypothetical protein
MSNTSLEQVARLAEQLSPADKLALVERLARELRVRAGSDDEKLLLMREAAADEMFLADLREVADDFKHADEDEHTA